MIASNVVSVLCVVFACLNVARCYDQGSGANCDCQCSPKIKVQTAAKPAPPMPHMKMPTPPPTTLPTTLMPPCEPAAVREADRLCPAQFRCLGGGDGCVCLGLVGVKRVWEDAECLAGNLVRVDDDAMLAMVLELLTLECYPCIAMWINAHYDVDEGKWLYVDDTSVSAYLAAALGDGQMNSCGVLDDDETIGTRDCDMKKPYVCQAGTM